MADPTGNLQSYAGIRGPAPYGSGGSGLLTATGQEGLWRDAMARMGPQMQAPEPPPQEQPLTPESMGLQDFYPANLTEHGDLLNWAVSAFLAADASRMDYQRRWERFYRQYRSYVSRTKGDWHSKVFYPVPFWVVEAVAPRLVANLPRFIVKPIGPEDVFGAKLMERLLEWAREESNLFVPLVLAVKSSLKYGTGILKIRQRQDIRRARRLVDGPPSARYARQDFPVTDPTTGQQAFDMDGSPMFDSRDVLVGMMPGDKTWQPYSYVAYEGPSADAVDIFNFWPAPEAEDIQTSRYVIHRVYREMSFILRRVQDGTFRIPATMTPNDIVSVWDEPMQKRLSQIGFGAGSQRDPTRWPVELLEIWTDDGRLITVANRKAILRCHESPYDHGDKPFARITDYLVEHEFWGVGELEPIEGLVDLTNALVNQRVDNVRLAMNKIFAVNTQYLEDREDLKLRPGKPIRVRGDFPAKDAVHPIDIGDVTVSAFKEVDYIQSSIERTTATSAYQLGMDSPSMNDTATGVSLIMEAGANRFTLKTRLQELMGLRDIARQYGALLLQFTNGQKAVRILGPDGDYLFVGYDPEAIQGSYDYDIETESSTQSQSQRRSDAMNLLQVVANYAPQAIPQLVTDLLEAFDKKNTSAYLGPQMGMMGGMQQQPSGLMAPPGGLAVPGPEAPQPPTPPQGPQPPQVPGLPAFQAPQAVRPMQRLGLTAPPFIPPTLVQQGPAR